MNERLSTWSFQREKCVWKQPFTYLVGNTNFLFILKLHYLHIYGEVQVPARFYTENCRNFKPTERKTLWKQNISPLSRSLHARGTNISQNAQSERYVCVKCVLYLSCWEDKDSLQLEILLHTYIFGDVLAPTLFSVKIAGTWNGNWETDWKSSVNVCTITLSLRAWWTKFLHLLSSESYVCGKATLHLAVWEHKVYF